MTIYIITPSLPENSAYNLSKTYHFKYYWGIRTDLINNTTNPEDKYMTHCISLISTKKNEHKRHALFREN